MTRSSAIFPVALGVTVLPVLTGSAVAGDSMQKLHNDVREIAIAVQDSLRAKAKDLPFFQRIGVEATIEGIERGCSSLRVSAETVKRCLNSLYEIPGLGEKGIKELNPLRDRWIAIQGLPPIADKPATGSKATWSVGDYNSTLQPAMKELRAACDNEPTARDETIACLSAAMQAAITFSDHARVGYDRAGKQQAGNEIYVDCTKPLTAKLGGQLEDSIGVADERIRGCLSTIHRLAYDRTFRAGAVDMKDYANNDFTVRGIIEIDGAVQRLKALPRGGQAFQNNKI